MGRAMDMDTLGRAQLRAPHFPPCPAPAAAMLPVTWTTLPGIDSKDTRRPPAVRRAALLLATLAQVVAQLDGDTGSPIPYFGLLLTAMEQYVRKEEPADVAAASALLLQLCVDECKPAVLASRFATAAQVVAQLLDHFLESADVVRPLLAVMHRLIKAVPSWSAETLKAYKLLMPFALDRRPKVRKAAQEYLADGLPIEVHTKAAAKHPAAVAVDRFVAAIVSSCNAKETLETLHTLNFVKLAASGLPATQLRSILNAIASLPRLGNTMLTQVVYDTFAFVLDTVTEKQLKASDYAALAATLKDIQPNRADSLLTERFSNVASRLFVNLHSRDAKAGRKAAASAVELLLPGLQNEKETAQMATAIALKDIIVACVDDQMIEEAIGSQKGGSPLHKLIDAAAAGLDYQYKQAWDFVLMVIAALFNALGRTGCPLIVDTLRQVEDLRISPDFQFSEEFELVIGAAVAHLGPAAFLKVMPLNLEPEVQTETAQAQQAGAGGSPANPPRDWLLPILRKYITEARLAFFATYFMDLASSLMDFAQLLQQAGKPLEARYQAVFADQIWDLFPAFCNVPVDTVETFPALAKTLGTALNNEIGLRPIICQGLANLIEKYRAVVDESTNAGRNASLTPEEAQASLDTIARFSKNFLPLLFNIFTATEPAHRAYIQRTITSYASITEEKLINEFFKTIVAKLLKADEVAEKAEQDKLRYDMADLSVALAAALDVENMGFLYQVVKPLIGSPDAHSVQKKCYKVLQKLLTNGEKSRAFMSEHGADVGQTLTEALPACEISSKKDRLKCLLAGMRVISPQLAQSFVPPLMAEVILGTKDSNATARALSYDLLVSMANAVAGIPQNDDDVEITEEHVQALVNFFAMVTAGLGGTTPHMIAATIGALARLLFEYEGVVNRIVGDLMDTTLRLFSHGSREIVKAVLGFVKVAISTLDDEKLLPYVPTIVQGMLTWSSSNKSHFRLKIRVLFERLIRKFGFDAVQDYVPEDDRKLLTHVKKARERAERKRNQLRGSRKQAEDGDDDAMDVEGAAAGKAEVSKTKRYEDLLEESEDEMEDSDEEAGGRGKGKGKGKGGKSTPAEIAGRKKVKVRRGQTGEKVWLKEGADATDFLSRTAANAIYSNDPSQKRKGRSRAFDRAADGRLVIPGEKPTFDQIGREFDRKDRGRALKRTAGDRFDEDDEEDKMMAKDKRIRISGEQQKEAVTVQERVEAALERRRARLDAEKPKKDAGPKGMIGADAYKAKKASTGGDVQRKGKLDPFAYLPLDPRLMNRRKSTKAAKAITTVLKKKSKIGKGAKASIRPRR